MANRYWRGGSGTWNTSSTTNWASSSGGGGGASVPTTADDVFFDSGSGTGTCTIDGGVSIGCRNITLNRANITLARSSDSESVRLAVLGVLTVTAIGFGSNVANAATPVFTLSTGASIAACAIPISMPIGIQAGVPLTGDATFTGTDGTCGSIRINGGSATRVLTINTGVTLTVNKINFAQNLAGGITLSGTAKLKFTGTGSLFLQQHSSAATAVLTAAAGSTIEVADTSVSSKTLDLRGRTVGIVDHTGNGELILTGANTLAALDTSAGAYDKTITFPASTTTVLTAMGATGTASNTLTLQSSSGAANATVNADSGGTTFTPYNVTLTRLTTSVGAGDANEATDGGNNVGWTMRKRVPSFFFGADL